MTVLNQPQIVHIIAALMYCRTKPDFFQHTAFKAGNTEALPPDHTDQLIQQLLSSDQVQLVNQSQPELSEKCQVLLQQGCKYAGSYLPEDVLSYIEEDLTMNEYQLLHDFLSWVVNEGRTFGHNLPDVYDEYVQSNS